MYYVVVYERQLGGNEVEVKRLGPFSESKARRLDTAMQINLNHESFHTRVEKAGVL